MKKNIKRKNLIYKDIESFESSSFINYIIYELMIRNKRIKELLYKITSISIYSSEYDNIYYPEEYNLLDNSLGNDYLISKEVRENIHNIYHLYFKKEYKELSNIIDIIKRGVVFETKEYLDLKKEIGIDKIKEENQKVLKEIFDNLENTSYFYTELNQKEYENQIKINRPILNIELDSKEENIFDNNHNLVDWADNFYIYDYINYSNGSIEDCYREIENEFLNYHDIKIDKTTILSKFDFMTLLIDDLGYKKYLK